MCSEQKRITTKDNADLSFLKELELYTFESKMNMCKFSSYKIMGGQRLNFEVMLKENILPWIIETFVTFAVIYDSPDAYYELTYNKFKEFTNEISGIRHPVLDHSLEKGTFVNDFIMFSTLQQLQPQRDFFQELFRYNYFFNFKNEAIDMPKKLKEKIGVEYDSLAVFAYALLVFVNIAKNNPIDCNIDVAAIHHLYDLERIVKVLSISKSEYKEKLIDLYNYNEQDYFFGLKLQYHFPIIVEEVSCYMPSPYLVINAVTESMLNRLTFKNKELRKKFGKEVLENYLYDIYSEIVGINWIRKEICYTIGKNPIFTPDVLVGEGDYCILFDTKAVTPNLKLRRLDEGQIATETKIYAKAIVQIYKQIINYLNGQFELVKAYKKENIFGVVVVLEDSGLSRTNVYNKVFELLLMHGIDDSQETIDYIHSHVKIIPLNQIENRVLNSNSYLPCLLEQKDERGSWSNYSFDLTTNNSKQLPSYELFLDELERKSINFLLSLGLKWNR